jgi:hypothetical protein
MWLTSTFHSLQLLKPDTYEPDTNIFSWSEDKHEVRQFCKMWLGSAGKCMEFNIHFHLQLSEQSTSLVLPRDLTC